jgi:hypothetical protein
MTSYYVSASGYYSLEVEADSVEDARQKAYEEIMAGNAYFKLKDMDVC